METEVGCPDRPATAAAEAVARVADRSGDRSRLPRPAGAGRIDRSGEGARGGRAGGTGSRALGGGRGSRAARARAPGRVRAGVADVPARLGRLGLDRHGRAGDRADRRRNRPGRGGRWSACRRTGSEPSWRAARSPGTTRERRPHRRTGCEPHSPARRSARAWALSCRTSRARPAVHAVGRPSSPAVRGRRPRPGSSWRSTPCWARRSWRTSTPRTSTPVPAPRAAPGPPSGCRRMRCGSCSTPPIRPRWTRAGWPGSARAGWRSSARTAGSWPRQVTTRGRRTPRTLGVLTARDARGRGHATLVAAAATADALAAGLLPQWRARVPASQRVAAKLGYRTLGHQLSVHLADPPG